MKKTKKSKSKSAAKELRLGKRAGATVTGGRITNVRANAAGVPAGGAGVPGQI